MPRVPNSRAPDTIEIVDENLRQGFAQVPRPVLRARGLSIKAKLVYIALLDYAWQKGSCFPGHATLADDLDTSIDTIQRSLSELQLFGLVGWKRPGLNKTNIYYLLRLSDCAPLAVSRWKPQIAVSRNRSLRHQETATARNKEYSRNNTQRERYSDIRKSKSEIIKADSDKMHQTTSDRIKARRKTSSEDQEGSVIDGDGHGQTVYQQIAAAPIGAPHPRRIDELVALRRQSLKHGSPGREQAEFLAYIGAQIEGYANELDDQAEPKWSINSILRLLRRSNLPQGNWDYELRQAFNQTAGRDVGNPIPGDRYRRNRFPYFRQVLADRLGLKGEGDGQ
jgi:hypothetical protein